MFCQSCGNPVNQSTNCPSCGEELAAKSLSYILGPTFGIPITNFIVYELLLNFIDVTPHPAVMIVIVVGSIGYGISISIKRWIKSNK
jgi:hypothetical protein